jgi:hypothetical protein
MATLKKSAKNTLLLEAPLTVLHQQSVEWIEELEFWKDECAFLYTLIRNSHNSPLLKTRPARVIERQLIAISNQRIGDMISEINAHEGLLGRVVEGKTKDEDILRRRHRAIGSSMTKLEMDFRKVKRQIFGLVKIKRDSVLLLPAVNEPVSKRLRPERV